MSSRHCLGIAMAVAEFASAISNFPTTLGQTVPLRFRVRVSTKRAGMILATLLLLAATLFGQDPPDPQSATFGVWKLNLQQSTFDLTIGPAPQSEIRTYESA